MTLVVTIFVFIIIHQVFMIYPKPIQERQLKKTTLTRHLHINSLGTTCKRRYQWQHALTHTMVGEGPIETNNFLFTSKALGLNPHTNTNQINLESIGSLHPIHVIIIYYQKFWVLQLSFATKIQLHATHATANLCSCIRQVAHDIQLHATLCIQHVYMMLIYMFIHTYQSKCSCTLYATLFATTIQLIRI